MSDQEWTPVTHDDCGDVEGPFYHGTRAPLRIVGEVKDWTGHPPEVIRQMLTHLDELRRAGRAVIED
jgi:hypothetical protein